MEELKRNQSICPNCKRNVFYGKYKRPIQAFAAAAIFLLFYAGCPSWGEIEFTENYSIQGSTGSGLWDFFASSLLKIKYKITYTAVIEKDLGKNVKVIIKSAVARPIEVDGRVSPKQLQYQSQANSFASEQIGKTRVISKESYSH